MQDNKCFVMQPFDGGNFDKRYNDVFKKAIQAAGFEPYRVDEDKTVSIPISDIEKNIRESSVCFAEISTDNPNVWYELGYAFAYNKSVIMVCSEERKDNFPFDIRHRLVIKYKTGSTSDFDKLAADITEKLSAIKKTERQYPNSSFKIEKQNTSLSDYESALIFVLSEHCFSPEDFLSISYLKQEMNKIGFTSMATSLAIRKLNSQGLIIVKTEFDGHEGYSVCSLTNGGEEWIIDNSHKVKLKIRNEKYKDEDDIPF